MKAFKYLITGFLFFSCSSQPKPAEPATLGEIRVDTAYQYTDSVIIVKQETFSDTLISVVRPDVTNTVDSLLHVIDSLQTKLFLAEYKVQRVRYYVAIVDRKPSQIKFLRGWCKRAIADH